MGIIKISKNQCFYPPRILNEHYKCIYSCLQIPPREIWFKYVRRVYTQLQVTFLALQPCGEVAKIRPPWVLLKLMMKFQILKILAFKKFF